MSAETTHVYKPSESSYMDRISFLLKRPFVPESIWTNYMAINGRWGSVHAPRIVTVINDGITAVLQGEMNWFDFFQMKPTKSQVKTQYKAMQGWHKKRDVSQKVEMLENILNWKKVKQASTAALLSLVESAESGEARGYSTNIGYDDIARLQSFFAANVDNEGNMSERLRFVISTFQELGNFLKSEQGKALSRQYHSEVIAGRERASATSLEEVYKDIIARKANVFGIKTEPATNSTSLMYQLSTLLFRPKFNFLVER